MGHIGSLAAEVRVHTGGFLVCIPWLCSIVQRFTVYQRRWARLQSVMILDWMISLRGPAIPRQTRFLPGMRCLLSIPPSFLPLESVTAGSNRPAVWQSDPCWAASLPVCLSDSKTHLKSEIHEPTLCAANSLLVHFYGFFLRWQWWNCIAASLLLLRHQSQNICCVWPFCVFSMWLLASPLCQSEDKLLWWHHKRLLYFLFQEEKPESPSQLQSEWWLV